MTTKSSFYGFDCYGGNPPPQKTPVSSRSVMMIVTAGKSAKMKVLFAWCFFFFIVLANEVLFLL